MFMKLFVIKTCSKRSTIILLCSSGSTRRLQLHQLLESNFPPITSASKLSREELLMWERKRQSPSWGITSYELHPSSGKIIFPAASNLFQCLDTGFSVSVASTYMTYKIPCAPSSVMKDVFSLLTYILEAAALHILTK